MPVDNIPHSHKYAIVWRKEYPTMENGRKTSNKQEHVHVEYYQCAEDAYKRGDYLRNITGVEPTLLPPSNK
jgi:hypothetical protein